MKPVFSSLKSFLGKSYRDVRMYLPIALVTFALCFPALAAAEITPEQPVSDITLVLNETVSIQFPHGTTDSIKEKGKWRHRIVEKPRLPQGLSFDQATRLLSGTPVKEHDAVHRYRVQYAWGKGKANMEKLVILFRLVVKKPDPIAAVEITPEQPVSDITLVLNETVSIQFPHGTTDSIKEKGKWRHRIVEKPRLPQGLSFDQATRLLSGTPVKEHDAVHRYRVQYAWGKGKANMEKLVIPFRLVVKKPDPIAARIRAFIGEARSVGEFAEGLPDLHKSQSLYLIASQALDRDFVSEEHPRMLSFGADARTIFAWGSDPDSDRHDTVEFIATGERRWHFGVIDFAEDPPVVTRDPEKCQSCHNNHPLWAKGQRWPGTLYEMEQKPESMSWRFVRSTSYDDALYQGFVRSSDPRISEIGAPPRVVAFLGYRGIPDEFTSQLAIRHGEILANQVIARPDFHTVAEKLVCDTILTLRSHWPRELIDLDHMGTGNGGLVSILEPDQRGATVYRFAMNAVLEEVIRLLLINHLYEIDSEIQDIYDSTSNADSSTDFKYLHFEPGTATAADELRSRVKLVKLAGQANVDKRNVRTSPSTGPGQFRDMHLHKHLHVMVRKVCNALRARDND